MRFLSLLFNSETMLDQLVPVNQEVHDDDVCRRIASPSSVGLSSVNDKSTTCTNNEFAAHPPMISIPNHPGQPELYGPWMSDGPLNSTGYSCHDSTREHDATQSVPVLGDTTFGCFPSPEMRSDYLSPYTFPVWYPDVHHSQFTFSTVTQRGLPFIFDPEMSTLDVLLYNEPSYRSQNFTIPQPGPSSGPLLPLIPPHMAVECSQSRFSTQPHVSQSGNISHPSDQPATSQPDSIPLHSHPSPPLLCRWLGDGTVCKFTGTLKALKAHCKISHFAGSQNAQVECRWVACDYHKRDDHTVRVMRRDCMWRHICEVHLGKRRGT
ncbi:hypothetical protein EDB19DRAFT_1679339 [Suillus lakei]|nr:hypothetical protein EDB19DRAFT_1679339 [Suillus lakei]